MLCAIEAVLRGDAEAVSKMQHLDTSGRSKPPLPLFHAIALTDLPAAVPLALAAGAPLSAASQVDRLTSPRQRHQLAPLVHLMTDQQLKALMHPLGTCSLSLAAALGHHRTLAALLAAGADPNPHTPCGQPVWHPLVAAALSADVASWSGSEAGQEEAAAVAMCRLLLGAGADISAALTACPPSSLWHDPPHRWLLRLASPALEHLLLTAILQRSQHHGWRPAYALASTVVLLAAQADDGPAFAHFASLLPPGRPPAEYQTLAGEAVAIACRSTRHGGVLRAMVQLSLAGNERQAVAAGMDPAAAAEAAAEPAAVAGQEAGSITLPAAHLARKLTARLEAAAAEGQLPLLAALLSAGVPVTPAVVRAAVVGGCPQALSLVLRYGAPPAEPLRPGTVLVVPRSSSSAEDEEEEDEPMVHGRAPQPYTCPLHTLLLAHARQGHDPLHPQSLAMAEALAAAGYRPAVYRDVVVRGVGGAAGGEERARRLPAFDPALQDPRLRVAGSGRYLWLAATQPAWSHAAHHRFPPTVQQAARTLLLIVHRAGNHTSSIGTCGGAGSPRRHAPLCALGRLPGHVLDDIMQLAAYPLSDWAQAPWEAAAAWLAGWAEGGGDEWAQVAAPAAEC